MPKYKVMVQEIIVHHVEVEAEYDFEAREKAYDIAMNNPNLCLSTESIGCDNIEITECNGEEYNVA